LCYLTDNLRVRRRQQRDFSTGISGLVFFKAGSRPPPFLLNFLIFADAQYVSLV
jgi:hypothetical protein